MDSFVRKTPVDNAWLVRPIDSALLLGVLFASTVFPRLMLLGGLPTTDEGFYAYQAQLIHHSIVTGRGLPDTGTLTLYPMLLAWVFEFSANHIILLRLADLCVAVSATLLLYRVLERESGSKIGAALLTLIFAFTMNQPIFIQCGFKNSITAAFVPLLLALRIGQQARSDSSRAWLATGALTALAVLLRETFISFALLGFVTLLGVRTRRSAFHFALGGAVSGALIVGGILAVRGGITQAIESYRDAGIVYASIADERINFFLSNGLASIKEAAAALLLSVLAILALFITAISHKSQKAIFRSVFWMLVTGLPLIEPASKIGFPYHFAVSLLGLSGLCAFAWHEVARQSGSAKWVAMAAGMAAVLLLTNKYSALIGNWPTTREAIIATPSGYWPADAVAKSNYLLAAEAIRNSIPRDGTLSVSGFMFTLYPLTGHLPPSPDLANLSAAMIKLGLSQSRLKDALLDCPPDVIMTTTRTDWPGGARLLAAVKATGIYEKVAEIANSNDRSYGGFGGIVFRRSGVHLCISTSGE